MEDLCLTEGVTIPNLQELDVASCKDASAFLHRIVEGEILNKDSKQYDTNAKEIMKFIENNLIPKMKEQSVEFRHMYHRIYGTGSYYDGLRNVSDSRKTELDINIVLSLSSPFMKEYFPEGSIQIITNKSVPGGFVKILCDEKCVNELQIKMGENHQTKCHFKKVDEGKYSEESNRQVKYFLHPNKTLQWFCKLVVSSIKEIKSSDLVGIESFSNVPRLLNRQGPSQPIQFILNSPAKTVQLLNVDLVVAFEFNADLYNPSEAKKEDLRKLKYDTEPNPFFFTIPKIMQSKKNLGKEKQAGATSESDSLNWRIDFHDQERIILDSEKFPLAKPTIRILKLYKHVHTINLSSYFIKSMVMWLIVRDKQSKETIFMDGHKLDETVLSTMNAICSFLHKKKAPYLFDDYCNLFWKTPPDQLDGMFRKISKDIDKLKNGGVEAWWKILIKRLKAVDESLFVKRGDTCGRALAWKQHEKRKNNHQKTYRDAKKGDDDAIEALRHIRKPNRIISSKKK